jgi:cytochrome c556
MKITWLFALAAGAGLILAGLGADRLRAAGGDVPSIEDIMQKVNKRKSGLHSQIGDALKAGTVNWEDVQKKTKEMAALADFLGKNDPPKGSKASWEKLTKTYADDAKALNTAAESKNQAAANAAIKKLSGECMGCHRVHRMM